MHAGCFQAFEKIAHTVLALLHKTTCKNPSLNYYPRVVNTALPQFLPYQFYHQFSTIIHHIKQSHNVIYLEVVLYRMPYFSHVPMFHYFTIQTTDILIQYRLLQTHNKSYKIVSKLANLLQLLGSIMRRMYKNYLMLISRYYSLRIYQYRLSQKSPIICCF